MAAVMSANAAGNELLTEIEEDSALLSKLVSSTSSSAAHRNTSPVASCAHQAINSADTHCGKGQAMPAVGDMADPSRSRCYGGTAEALHKPLGLLDLPLDILKEIVQKVTHTNDLAALALTHTALHDLAVPHIYSRFDIVWPDAEILGESRTGVDALTYGLATLVMGEDIFRDKSPKGSFEDHEAKLYYSNQCRAESSRTSRPKKRRRGNDYAKYTKKFSLGNGPLDWVTEYAVTKESGKMLGTLVALAIARMHNLETFIWDMPTGILRDVWTALASLGDRRDCRLQRVWIRWHDSMPSDIRSSAPVPAPPPPPLPVPHAASGLWVPQTIHPVGPPPNPPSYQHITSSSQLSDHVGRSTFSLLPPLKSISVLDIDDLAYLDEMSVLIGKSRRCLKELRVGISHRARSMPWVAAWEGEGAQQTDQTAGSAASRNIGQKRLGGVLGVLVGRIYDMRQADPTPDLPGSAKHVNESTEVAEMVTNELPLSQTAPDPSAPPVLSKSDEVYTPLKSSVEESALGRSKSRLSLPLRSKISGAAPQVGDDMDLQPNRKSANSDNALESPPSSSSSFKSTFEHQDASEDVLRSIRSAASSPSPNRQGLPPPLLEDDGHNDLGSPNEIQDAKDGAAMLLTLENLELERFPLAVSVLQNVIDWSKLTSLTILDCANAEQLWKTLRKVFSPDMSHDLASHEKITRAGSSSRASRPRSYRERAGSPDFNYKLNLNKIHTNIVSNSLISLLKETLAPNSLEVLFLQDSRNNPSSVGLSAIWHGALRRHKGSLKKLLIDSSEKHPDGKPTGSTRWGKWMLDRTALGYITSGHMSGLRELSVAMDYRHWHYFLQRLPAIPHLRSLHIPFMAHHVHGTNIDPRELSLHIIDIVALRPEIELCYMGISSKCFEIMELPRFDPDYPHSTGLIPLQEPHNADVVAAADDDDDENENEDDDDEPDDDSDGGGAGPTAAAAAEDTDSASDSTPNLSELEEDRSVSGNEMPRLRLREILFFDDKVAIFKARHGRI